MKRHRNYQSSYLTKRSEKKAKRRFLLTLIIAGVLLYATLTWILPALIGSLSILNQFKPAPKKEASVSENTTLAPPVLNIPYEATNSARINIEGYAAPSIRVEIYLDGQLAKSTKTEENGSFIFKDIALNVGSNSLYGQTVGEKEEKSLPSKPIIIIYDNGKPQLTVKEPQDNQVFQEDNKIKVSGNTNTSEAVSLEINKSRVIIDSEGNFSKTIELNEGENEIVIKAIDTAGNITQITRKVTYQKPLL